MREPKALLSKMGPQTGRLEMAMVCEFGISAASTMNRQQKRMD